MLVSPAGVAKNHNHDPKPSYRGLPGDWNESYNEYLFVGVQRMLKQFDSSM